ncbi:MAG: DUF177 domain-containing protein [Hyphomicrobiales bacterium]
MTSKKTPSNEAIEVEHVLPRPLAVSAIPRNGYQTTLTLSDDEKAAVCTFYNLLEVLKFEADITLTKRTTTKFIVEGRLKAKVHQPCVVSLAPVETIIDEDINLVLLPEDEFERFLERKDEDGSLIISLEDDIPDTYQGDKVQLGVLVLEHLALGLHPYPQAEGAELEEGSDDGELRQNPFAGLASLKDKLKPN